MSLTDLTTRAAWIAGLAMVALLFAGWRKPARATPRTPRAQHRVTEIEAPFDERTPLWRKGWALIATASLTLVVAAVAATVIAYSAAWTVTTLTELLKD